MIKAVIFDMDGLLIDSEPIWRSAHKKVLANRGFAIAEEDVREMAGKGTLHIVSLWRHRFGGWTEEDDQVVCEEIFKEVAKGLDETGTALPGAKQIVEQLYEMNIPLAVASSSPVFLIKRTLEKLELESFISILHSGVDEVHPKPAPDVYLSAAKSLHIDPQHCLVFEDSPSGIASAKAAGMVCVAVPEPGRDLAIFSEADSIIPSLTSFDVKALQ